MAFDYHGDYWTELKIYWNLRESAGISRNLRESEGISRNQQESAGISRNQQELARIGRNQKELIGSKGISQEFSRNGKVVLFLSHVSFVM